MPDINFQFLSDQVQNCLNELFNETYKKDQSYIDAVSEISVYLIGENDKYDYILNKYNNVNKELLNQMVFSNFLEITYYRRKNDIPVDKERLSILNNVESITSSKSEGLMDLMYLDSKQFFLMLNDVLLYFWHLSPIYSYNIVQCIIKDGFAKKLYSIYPLAMNEHMLTLDDSFSAKQLLLYTFYETLINATERIEFSNGGFPVPDAGYTQRLANILKIYNGKNPKLLNIHKEIFDDFTNRTNLNKKDENKTLIIEIIISTIRAKQRYGFPLEQEEKCLIDLFDKSDKSAASITELYDNNQQVIVSSLINNWNYFSDEELLGDLPELKDTKQKKKL